MYYFLGLLIILIILITVGIMYVRTVARNTFSIEELLSPPWDDTSDTSVKTAESGAKPRKPRAATKKKTGLSHAKNKKDN